MASLTPLEHQQLHVAPAATFWHRVRFEVVLAHVRQRGATAVLDIGAGSGLLGDHLAGTGIGYRYAEESSTLLEALRARFGEESLDDGAPIGCDTVVTLLDVIEHVEDDAGLLGELAARMEPGAGLVVTVPAMRWLFSSWDRDLGHHRRYQRAELSALATRCGFDVEETGYLFPELVLPAAIRKFRRSDGAPAEFPTLPAAVDRVATALGRGTARFRRRWPCGTSALLVARRNGREPS